MARNSIISYKNTIQMIVKKRAKVLFHGQNGAIGSLNNTTSTAARTSSENVTTRFCNNFSIIQTRCA